MHTLDPAVAHLLGGGAAGEVQPRLVDEGAPPVHVGHPDQHRRRVGDGRNRASLSRSARSCAVASADRWSAGRSIPPAAARSRARRPSTTRNAARPSAAGRRSRCRPADDARRCPSAAAPASRSAVLGRDDPRGKLEIGSPRRIGWRCGPTRRPGPRPGRGDRRRSQPQLVTEEAVDRRVGDHRSFWSAASWLCVTPMASRTSRASRMKERRGNTATRASISSNDRSSSHVMLTRSVNRANARLNSVFQYRSSGVAPSTTTMLVVSGASYRISTRPPRSNCSPTKVAFGWKGSGGSVRRSIPV